MTEKKNRGRKKEVLNGQKIGLLLTEEMIWDARMRGGKNRSVSAGVRIALDYYKEHHKNG